MTKPLSEADWKIITDKSEMEARQWITHNSQHLEKLKEWLNTEVKIVESDTSGKHYNGDIRELIGRLNVMLTWICSFIKKIKSDPKTDVNKLIHATVLPFDRVYGPDRTIIMDTSAESNKQGMHVETFTQSDIMAYKSNLLTLCNAILKLDEDELQALHAMLCLRNDKGQSLYDWTAWGMLVTENRENQGYTRSYQRTADDSVSPWIKPVSKGGRRTRHKRSGHKRSDKKRSGKRSGKRMSRRR
jgi:hypothetical protein